jgi:tetratricopeptide (TPR) repeat protein
MYQDMVMYMSAYELLKDVELSEDAIKCLYMAGRESQALELANEVLARYEKEGVNDPKYANMLCMIGDVKRDPRLYTQAWEVSKNRCARAMRSLAKWKFQEGKFTEATECWQLAFAINMLFPKDWFTCGCAYMQIKQWDKAIYAFGTSINIDEQDTEAWGNLASCYH